MIRIVRQVNRLAVLVLLLSGLLQSFAAAQGMTCARTHSPAHVAPQPVGPAVGGAESASDGQHLVAIEHEHSSIPQSNGTSAPSAASCGAAALPVERRWPSPAPTARHLLTPGEFPPASLLIQSLFRPPRLS